ncbi:MAG: hypothetical protein ABIR19_05675 [Ginsengibacter sp.]
MAKSTTIAALILGASIGAALLKFYSMPKEDQKEFIDHLKKTTHDLLDDAENTVEKVEHFIGEFKTKGEDEWVDKLYILKKMFSDFYGSKTRHLI